MTDNNETVAVPVELLKRLVKTDSLPREEHEEVTALLPKPKPRLVAVDIDAMNEKFRESEDDAWRLMRDQPDLLTLLDETIDGIPTFGQESRDLVKARIRAALGISGAQ